MGVARAGGGGHCLLGAINELRVRPSLSFHSGQFKVSPLCYARLIICIATAYCILGHIRSITVEWNLTLANLTSSFNLTSPVSMRLVV